MDLPISPPLKPMLAKATKRLPADGTHLFEPKWDGFRCIVFRDGNEVYLGSRNEKPLTRYFPEMPGHLQAALPDRAVVDGELVMVTPEGLDFDMLGNRIHPAESRINMLAEATPATFVAFDLLALGSTSFLDRPFEERRSELEAAISPALHVRLTPASRDPEVALDWFERFEGAGFDGVMAKSLSGVYEPNKRVLLKVKHQRELDAVVAGYRVHKDGAGVGSLLLGLYSEGGNLQHVGVASSFTAVQRTELTSTLAPYVMSLAEVASHPWSDWAQAEAHESGVRMPGAPNRWSGQRDHSWIPLRPELVAEVGFQQLTHGRLRHPAAFLRWRPDKDAGECTYDQFEVAVPAEFESIFGV